MRLLLALASLLTACATARPLVPLGAGGAAVEASVPGVLVEGDTYVAPVGVLLLGGRYGLSDALEVRARIHAFTLAKGIVGLEGGAVYHVRPARGLAPGLHLTGDVSVLTSPAHWGSDLPEGARGATSLGVLADVEPLGWLRPYVVVDQTVVWYDGAYVLSAMAGAQVALGRFELSLEVGLVGLNHDTRAFTEPYVGLGGHGAVWLSWGLAYRLGAAAGQAR